MEKKKIIIIGTAWPYRGGIAAFNERLALEFQKQGSEVSIENFTLQYPSLLFPGKSQYADRPAPENLLIKRSVNAVNPFNWIRAGNRLRRAAPDIVIFRFWLPFMGPCFGTIARRIRKNRAIKIITIIDNIVPHEHRIGDRLFTRYFIRPIDSFITMSDKVMKDLSTFDLKKPRALCPHPLYDHFGERMKKEDARKHLDLDPNARYVMFFGFIRDYKGLDLLIRAFGEAPLRDTDIRLLIAGEFYADREKYLSLIRQSGIDERVVLRTDFIPDDQVRYYFSACDIVAQPYTSATQSGISQIAYHFNTPMIVTNVGGLPEIVPDGRVGYVAETDPKDIAEKIDRFYREDRESEFRANARKEKQKYSWETLVRSVFDLAYQ